MKEWTRVAAASIDKIWQYDTNVTYLIQRGPAARVDVRLHRQFFKQKHTNTVHFQIWRFLVNPCSRLSCAQQYMFFFSRVKPLKCHTNGENFSDVGGFCFHKNVVKQWIVFFSLSRFAVFRSELS